jgi:dTDP-4-dehydrorhamnose 3,5-epimerase-like enzyme
MKLIHFRSVHDPTGNLTIPEIPFEVRNVFFLHDIPEGAQRGGHAHRELQEVVIAVSGAFDVEATDEHGPHWFTLNRATEGLYLNPQVWRRLTNFSGNAVALVLASTPYDPADYIHDYEAFLASLPALAEDWFSKRRFQEVEAWQKTR